MWNLITLDGYFEGENSWDLDFHQLVWGKELEEFSIVQLKSADILVFGKTTYMGMADYWTTETEEVEIAKLMNNIQKVVCSSTLKSTNWNNTAILTNVVDEITKLKTEGNGNMFVFGSGNLSETLMKAGLFDEYRLCISPVLLGKGKLLFNQGIHNQKLKLVETIPLATGGIILRYTPENMKEIQFSIEINASKENVWATLWEDTTFRDWANAIDEGTYMKGEMKEGNEIQFISSVNGYGVTSLIEKLNPNTFVLFRHEADTKENGQQEREKEWMGGTESYSLTENNGATTLIAKMDIPLELEEIFNIRFPKALERIKILAEKMQ
jgi:dihydrofolate reductase/uncharacterized protein YndB with AHSA1/START domain